MRDDFSVEDVARFWDDNAAAWAEQVRRGADVAREWLNNPAFLAFIGDLRGRRVLDMGCGEGYNTRILARRGASMTGIDLSERMIALAHDEERRQPLGIEYVRASYTDLAMQTATAEVREELGQHGQLGAALGGLDEQPLGGCQVPRLVFSAVHLDDGDFHLGLLVSALTAGRPYHRRALDFPSGDRKLSGLIEERRA